MYLSIYLGAAWPKGLGDQGWTVRLHYSVVWYLIQPKIVLATALLTH